MIKIFKSGTAVIFDRGPNNIVSYADTSTWFIQELANQEYLTMYSIAQSRFQRQEPYRLLEPVRFDEVQDENGNTFPDFATLLAYLQNVITPAGASAAVVYSYFAENYNDLLVQAPAPLVNQLAYVRQPQGTPWLPGSLGGSYRPKGAYLYDGANWVSDKNLVAAALEDLVNDVAQLLIDIGLLTVRVTAVEGQSIGTVTVHSDVTDAGSGQIITPQERIDINASVNVHSDVDLLDSVSPNDGWVARWQGGQLRLFMKETYFYEDLVINQIAGSPPSPNPFTFPFNFQRAGTYSLEISGSWSLNDGGQDMVIIPRLGTTAIYPVIANNELFRDEPKEVGGNNGDGRGTDNKRLFSHKFPFAITAGQVGNNDIVIDFFCPTANDEASIWNLHVTVEEDFNTIILP